MEPCPAVRRCRRDCVCIYEAWALPLLGEKTLLSSVVEALQCRQNADMPITEVMVVTNDKKRQLDNTIAVM